MTELFTEKFLPKDIKSYTGFNHQSVLQYIERVLSNKEKKKGIIFHGSPGTGKTTLAMMVPDHFDIAFSYSNASDARKKGQINVDTFRTTSLQSKKSLMIFDEVDGLSKSAFKELEKAMKKYTQPIILIANDLTKIPYSIRKICHVEKFSVDRFSLMALANKVIKAEKLDLNREEITKIVDRSKSYRDVLYAIQFGVSDTNHAEQLSPDLQVLNTLQNKSTRLSGDLNDLIVRFNDNTTNPNLISMADLWNRRYVSGYTYGKYVVRAILSSIRNPDIKKLKYPRTYALIHQSRTGKKQIDHSDEKKSRKAPKIKILGFK